nr:unnamed protein product [Callosobruchus analis]CAI5860370.1 unnamed protein product [Callosobruchus analis]
MPRHRCVPGCKINYSSELKSTSYRSVFRFPKNEELKSKWLAAIPRKELVVCSSHFRISEILTTETFLLDGLHNTVLLKSPKLLECSLNFSKFCRFIHLSVKWFLALNT